MSIAMSDQRRLEDKVAIITGGASGIGASTVHVFHENGAKVVVADIQDGRGQAIADKLGENVCFIHCDVSNEEDVTNLIDTTVSKFGKLDIMYNNAGIMDRPVGGIVDAKKSDLERLIGINLVGAFLGAKHAARVMIPKRKGCILFTTSACTSIAGLSSHSYAASKYAILGLAKNLTPDLGRYGIRVNCISPYGLVTSQLPGITEDQRSKVEIMLSDLSNLKGEVLKPECVAKAALYLASDEANYVSGLNLLVDGGYSVVNPTMMKFNSLFSD